MVQIGFQKERISKLNGVAKGKNNQCRGGFVVNVALKIKMPH